MFCNANCLPSHHRRSQGWEACDCRAVSDQGWLLHSIQGHLTSWNYPLLRWWRGHLESWTKGAPWNFLFSIWPPTWMYYLLSKGRGAKGPFLADISIKLHHCLQLTGYWYVWTPWTDGETGGKKVWADGSKCSEFPPASHLSGLLDWRKQCCLREVLRVSVSSGQSDQSPPPPSPLSQVHSGFTWTSPRGRQDIDQDSMPFSFQSTKQALVRLRFFFFFNLQKFLMTSRDLRIKSMAPLLGLK